MKICLPSGNPGPQPFLSPFTFDDFGRRSGDVSNATFGGGGDLSKTPLPNTSSANPLQPLLVSIL
jgi:hypothetical protein